MLKSASLKNCLNLFLSIFNSLTIISISLIDFSISTFPSLKWLNQSEISFEEAGKVLKAVKKVFKDNATKLNTPEEFRECLANIVEKNGFDNRGLHMTVRVAVAGVGESLPLYESLALLGVYRCITRFDEAISALEKFAKESV